MSYETYAKIKEAIEKLLEKEGIRDDFYVRVYGGEVHVYLDDDDILDVVTREDLFRWKE